LSTYYKHVQSNPQVGAVITYKGKIIGEGYHHQYGQAHAERDALANVKPENRQYLPQSHMYVSLEPCNHHGKTPPCSQAIIDAKIPRLTICTEDPTPKLQGKSIAHLRSKGVAVREGLMQEEGIRLIQPFVTNNISNGPYTILKWAQSQDRYIGIEEEQIWLSNKISKVQVHSWRAEVDAILIGTNTAITDDPLLNTRLIDGSSPRRIVLDKTGRLDKSLKLLSDSLPTTIITATESYQALSANKEVIKLVEDDWYIDHILSLINKMGVKRLMIEGGATLLRSIIKENLWDEARVTHTDKILGKGIKAPKIKGKLIKCYKIANNKCVIISRL